MMSPSLKAEIMATTRGRAAPSVISAHPPRPAVATARAAAVHRAAKRGYADLERLDRADGRRVAERRDELYERAGVSHPVRTGGLRGDLPAPLGDHRRGKQRLQAFRDGRVAHVRRGHPVAYPEVLDTPRVVRLVVANGRR